MIDRELLELAATACELPECGWMADTFTYVKDNTFTTWDPLTDDGDALRLAVKLNIVVVATARSGWACAAVSQTGAIPRRGNAWHTGCEIDGDPSAATRRAIVRAAAEIGKAMK